MSSRPVRCVALLPAAFLALTLPLLLLLTTCKRTALPAVVHNGSVAVAVPVDGITIDGDLSDPLAHFRRCSRSWG